MMATPAAPVAHHAGQLPAETTGFVGRKSELATVGRQLRVSRLVTVTGPGGVGKTRLALRAAVAADTRYHHPVAFAELSALRDPELLPYTVGAALGLPQRDGRPALENITDYLRDRELLLVLDTCEHVIDAAALFAEALLSAAPRVRILATSRQPLDVIGESVCPLGPLHVPDDGALADREAAGDAVELFAQRAAAAVAGFAVTPDNSAEVARVCRRLEGIPLAIELAAVRLRSLSLGDLAERLDSRLQILDSGRRGAEPRHQALRDAFGWSYELCGAAEQALWARLSVFAGPFSVEAAEEVCAGDQLPRGEVFGTLISLVDKSVVIKSDQGRYRLLDTVREYGAERLAESAEADRVRSRLLRRYLRLAQELDSDPLTDQQPRYLTLLAEHDSIRATLGHAFTIPGQTPAAARLTTSLYWYWHISGLMREATHWIGLALDSFPEPSELRAAALVLRGLMIAGQGDPEAGVADCQNGIAMAEAAGDARTYARGHLYYCQVLLAAHKREEAIAAGEAAARLMPAAGDGPTAKSAHLYLGLLHLHGGDVDKALQVAGEGLRALPSDGGEKWVSSFLFALTGICLFVKGDTERGSLAIRRSLAARRELGDPMGLGYGLGLLGYTAAKQGRFRRAAWLLGAASPLWEQLGNAAFIGASGLRKVAGQAAAETRKELGDDVFDELFEAAARSPLEEAIDLAIADSDDLPALAAGSSGTDGTDRLGGALSDGEPADGVADGSSGAEEYAAAAGATLTEREAEIAGLVASGLSNRQIAEKLIISKRTVDTHVARIFAKAGLTSRVQLAHWVRTRR
jgi:predicted ATPase/DNA-binding CsgD family transcriptional regulator